MIRILCTALFLLVIVFSLPATGRVVNGIADFTEHDFTKEPVVELEGLWEFYWKQFVDDTSLETAQKKLVFFPNNWAEYVLDNEHLPVFGYASYRLTLRLSGQPPGLGLQIPIIASAYTLFLNGRPIISQGRVGQSRDEMEAHIEPVVVPLPKVSGEVTLVLHVSNFYSNVSGCVVPLRFGVYERLAASVRRIEIICYVLIFLLVLCCIALAVRLLRTKGELYLFYLSGLSLLTIINISVYEEMIIYHLLPAIPFDALNKLLSLLPFTSGAFLLAYTGFCYPAESVRALRYAAVVYLFFVLINMIFLNSYEFENFPVIGSFRLFLPLFAIISQLMVLYCFVILSFAVKHKRQGALFYLILLLLFVFAGFAGYTGFTLCGVSLLAYSFTLLVLLLTIRHSLAAATRGAGAAPPVRAEADSIKADFMRGYSLSKREEQIMSLLLEGECSKTIASALGLSVRTVENYTYRIFGKCGLRSRTEILARYYEYRVGRRE